MSGSTSWGDFFDSRKIRRLAELMNEQDLSEIDLQQGEVRLRLRRRLEIETVQVQPRGSSRPAAEPVQPPATPSAASDHLTIVKSPMVGTFYVSASPDAPPFVKVGDHVGPETTVCIIEAMKVFNEIPAETSGKIVAVLVENGAPVEFNQPLFKLDRSQ